MKEKLSNFKGKVLASSIVTMALASAASAAVTVSDKGVASGELDLAPFFGAFGLVLVAGAAIWAGKRALGLLR